MERVIESVDHVVTEEMAQSLVRPYTEEEVRTALFQMHPSKSPGPDGMSPFFFQKFWRIVGNDVTASVLSFLHSGRYLRKMNFTHCTHPQKKMIQNILQSSAPLALVILYRGSSPRSLQTESKLFYPM